jgi:hypothetical protein
MITLLTVWLVFSCGVVFGVELVRNGLAPA